MTQLEIMNINFNNIIGVSEAKPLSSGWCKTGSFGTSHLVSTSGTYVALHNSLPCAIPSIVHKCSSQVRSLPCCRCLAFCHSTCTYDSHTPVGQCQLCPYLTDTCSCSLATSSTVACIQLWQHTPDAGTSWHLIARSLQVRSYTGTLPAPSLPLVDPWQLATDNVNRIKLNKSYKLNNVAVRLFDGRKYLSPQTVCLKALLTLDKSTVLRLCHQSKQSPLKVK